MPAMQATAPRPRLAWPSSGSQTEAAEQRWLEAAAEIEQVEG